MRKTKRGRQSVVYRVLSGWIANEKRIKYGWGFFLLAFHCFFHLIEWGLLLSFSSLIEFYRILLALINCDGFFHCFHLFYSVKFSSRFSFSIFSSLRGLAHLIRWNDRLHLFFFFCFSFLVFFFYRMVTDDRATKIKEKIMESPWKNTQDSPGFLVL